MSKKVLVIDDSALMRRKLRMLLEEDKDYEVRTARDGQDGLETAIDWRPDVITLDINMPKMDGLTCLSLIMEQAPCPVVMVSSLTAKGALATFEALELGAVDYVPKPGGTVSVNLEKAEKEIKQKVAGALRARIAAKPISELTEAKRKVEEKRTVLKTSQKIQVVVIGVSTGGPNTIEQILSPLPKNFKVPILIAQHMPEKFTGVFAKRLDKVCNITINHVDKPMELKPGNAYIAKGDADMVLTKRLNKITATSMPPNGDLWHPSIERLVNSVGDYYDAQTIVAVMLTGMGGDGANAMSQLHHKGSLTIAESETTSVVFGMPRELIERDGATTVLPNFEIASQLIEWVS